MSRTSTFLATASAVDVTRETAHRISVTLTDDIVNTIQQICPCEGALNWCLQHAAANLVLYVKRNEGLFTRDADGGAIHTGVRLFIEAVTSGTAFLRTPAVGTPTAANSDDVTGRAARVRQRTATVPHPSGDARSDKQRKPRTHRSGR